MAPSTEGVHILREEGPIVVTVAIPEDSSESSPLEHLNNERQKTENQYVGGRSMFLSANLSVLECPPLSALLRSPARYRITRPDSVG